MRAVLRKAGVPNTAGYVVKGFDRRCSRYVLVGLIVNPAAIVLYFPGPARPESPRLLPHDTSGMCFVIAIVH